MIDNYWIVIFQNLKNIFALEQRAIVLSFVKNAAFLLGHPVQYKILKDLLRNGARKAPSQHIL